ncbi:MAG: hypothetical protein DRI95_04075 [Bacteroidetes bacterium]|nr:MAG: hypothetical protein DRI95_04075 [Bacteroidota bacterium]RLD82956.1 MAG: hypothetical protein DRJ07_07645 [Bacteroidota bacterium]
MKILDFNKIAGFPYEKRYKNVLYNTDDFKIRIIDLPENGSIPECNMESHVVFVVMHGQVDINVNGEKFSLPEKQSLASEPGTFSMSTISGAKLMGIQIKKH